ncbi:gamma-butyrobetaine dioxygenase-like isoform X1 [Sycon ciliatum]|uniref:gamma-butyrobetaine dioxygenase-like isoform X1 n=2 Tax=Sycon ciliatum TaxID=27933 RepID=UPI0031F6E891
MSAFAPVSLCRSWQRAIRHHGSAVAACTRTPGVAATYHSVACSGVKQRLPARPLSSVSGKCCSSVRWKRTVASSANTATQPKLITSSSFDANERMISVQLGESPSSTVYTYPGIYLRDNCTCPTCLHTSGIRAREMVMWEPSVIDKMTSIKNVQTVEGGSAMQIKWGDEHVSTYPADWLRAHRLTAADANNQISTSHFVLPARKHWQADGFPRDTNFSLPSLLKSEEKLQEFLLSMHEYGVALVRDCGTDEGAVKQLAEKVAFLRHTVFGLTWLIRVLPNPNSIAYTTYEAPMHIDLPYMDTPPGILMLHCLSQAPTGGLTYCTDGFHIAEQLRRDDPDTFRVLCDVPVTWSTHGHDSISNMDYYFQADAPVIELDRDGDVKTMRLNQVRSSFLKLDADKVARFYAALHTLSRMSCDARYRAAVRLEPGEMILIDNHRMLHGRSELDAAGAAVRCLSGGYMDWDLVVSRMRSQHKALAK